MTNTDLLLALIADYKATQCEGTLEAIAELVENDYEALCPILTSHGVTY